MSNSRGARNIVGRNPFTESPVEWAVSADTVDYPDAVRAMQDRAARVAQGGAPELVWLLEHPAIYTAGTSARLQDLLLPDRFPLHRTGRGGQLTYHGPGQRIVYVMLDVKRRTGDVRAFVGALEDWIIGTLAELGVAGERRGDRVGVWVRRADKGPAAEDKIAAIGLRLSKWVSLHGLSLNVAPNLAHYDGIVPCGVSGYGVTSLAELGVTHAMEVVDNVLRRHFERRFGPTREARALGDGANSDTFATAERQRRSPAP
jgi:lipoyl(octanoyl) transferase